MSFYSHMFLNRNPAQSRMNKVHIKQLDFYKSCVRLRRLSLLNMPQCDAKRITGKCLSYSYSFQICTFVWSLIHIDSYMCLPMTRDCNERWIVFKFIMTLIGLMLRSVHALVPIVRLSTLHCVMHKYEYNQKHMYFCSYINIYKKWFTFGTYREMLLACEVWIRA